MTHHDSDFPSNDGIEKIEKKIEKNLKTSEKIYDWERMTHR